MYFSLKIKLILILATITALAYGSSLVNPFIWDDEQFIQKNTYVQELNVPKIFTTNTIAGSGEQSNYYRPLTTFSFAIDAKIWGQNTFGFHLTNIFLHISTGILLFVLLQDLGIGVWATFFICLVFLIDPVQTEAVTYINSRGDSLYAVFLFFSLCLYAEGVKKIKQFGVGRMVIIVILYVCSLLSKEIALAGSILFPLIYFALRKKKKLALWFAVVPLALSVGYFFLRLTVLNFGNTLNFYGENNTYTTHLAIRLLTFAKVLCVYVGILIWPHPLHMERSVELIQTIFSPWVIGAIVALLVVAASGIFEVLMKKSAWILIGIIWFLGMLIPSSGIIPINGILYEHWLYIPIVGFSLLIYGLYGFLLWLFHKDLKRKYLIILFCVICGVYFVLTIVQNSIWSDPIRFYTYTLNFAPKSARLYNNLGMTLQEKGNNAEAIKKYEKALSLGSRYPQIYYNLGNAYLSESQYKKAEYAYVESIKIAPNFLLAKFNLLLTYLQTNQFTKSLSLFSQLEPYYGNNLRFSYNYGLVLWKLGKKAQAEQKFSNAIMLSGNDPQVIQAVNQIKSQ